MGLLDFFNQGATPPNPDATLPQFLSTPMGQGLLGAAFSYAANAQRGTPINNIGRGGLGGLLAYGQTQDRDARLAEEQQQRTLRQLQIRQAQQGIDDDAAAREILKGQYGSTGFPTVPVGPPSPAINSALPPEFRIPAPPQAASVTPKADIYSTYRNIATQMAAKGLTTQAQKYSELAEKFRPKFSTTPQQMMVGGKLTNVLVGEDGTLKTLDGYGVKPDIELKDTGGGFQAVDKNAIGPGFSLPKTGNPYSDLILADGQGGFRQNAPLIGAKQSIAKAGATNVRIENKLGEGIAAQVGPMLKDSYVQANGAAGTVDAANRIIQAADSGSLIAGPGANARLKIAQWGDLLGVAGKDTTEKIANTRQAIRGLAEMTLQGRKQMRGEGQITEQESALAERAASGNLEDLTVAEVKQLAKASDRAARFIYGQHSQMVDNLMQDPNTAGLAKFYKPLPLPQSATSPKRPQLQPKPAQRGALPLSGGVTFLGIEGE